MATPPKTIPPNFLFRFRFSCRRCDAPTARSIAPETLDASFRVPLWSLVPKGEVRLERQAQAPPEAIGVNPEIADFFDFRIGWAPEGLVATVVVSKKDEQPVWPRSALDQADSLRLCLDMRDMKDARRATRFCYKFVFFPLVGESPRSARPIVQWSSIARAREIPSGVDLESFLMASKRRSDGYSFTAFIPAASLNGYDPEFFARFGMHYTVSDSQRGLFTLQHSAPLPYDDDPSLWAAFQTIPEGDEKRAQK